MANVALPVGPLASISGRVDDSKRVERAWASTAGQLECKGGHIRRRRKWSGVGRGRVTYLHHTRTVPREGRAVSQNYQISVFFELCSWCSGAQTAKVKVKIDQKVALLIALLIALFKHTFLSVFSNVNAPNIRDVHTATPRDNKHMTALCRSLESSFFGFTLDP